MIIKDFKIPDEVYEKYKKYNAKDPEMAMSQQLIRFQEVRPSSRMLLVPEKQRAEFEILFDRYVDSADELLTLLKKAISLKVNGVEVALTPDQLDRLSQMAQFEGKKLDDFTKQKIEEGVRFTIDGYV